MNGIRMEQVNVTPAMAEKWLDAHWEKVATLAANKQKPINRPISMTRVLRYAQAMADGQWKFSPEPIVFDVAGNLIQGQHRLEALKRAGVTIPMFVSQGWPVDETINVLDQGLTRSNTALLALKEGYGGYSSRYVGTVSVIARIAYRGHATALSFANCEFMLERLGLKDNIDSVLLKSSPLRVRDFQSSVVGPLAYYHTVHPDKASAFADSLFNFETTKGSPVNLYLNWIKSGRWQYVESATRLKNTYTRKIAGLCACIRAWDENSNITRIVVVPEAIEWLANLNPKLRDWIKTHVTGSWKYSSKVPGRLMEKKEANN